MSDGGQLYDAVIARFGQVDTNTTNIAATNQNVYNSWFGGSSATGTPAEVATAVTSIQVAVKGGYTLQTFSASNAAWSVPAGLATASEAWAGAIGGGGKGGNGSLYSNSNYAGTAFGGFGGSSGGYVANKFDPATLGATLNVTVGAAASSASTDGGTTSIVNGATTLVQSTPNVGAISDQRGYQGTTSKPGAGGDGGTATIGNSLQLGSAQPGRDGESSATAAGGAGGTASTGSAAGGAGSAGASGNTGGVPVSGGSGGGGGGGKSHLSGTDASGNGGNGGFPGGGSGGGGGLANGVLGGTAGIGGTPGNGFAFLLWK